MMGAAAITKKRGGYTNTKLHGMMAWAGLMLAGAGLYVIYKHKNVMGKDHFTTYHSWGEFFACVLPFLLSPPSLFAFARFPSSPNKSNFFFSPDDQSAANISHIDASRATKNEAGLAAFGGCISAGMAGGAFLHPDFGVDKQNKLIRSVHKYLGRSLLFLAWMATLSGLKTLVGDDYKTLVLFAAPLVVAAPFTLM